MKTQTLFAVGLVLLSAVAFLPGASAQDLCGRHPTLNNEVCCKAPSSPTTQFYCTVRGAASDYAGYYVDAVLDLERCLVDEHPIGDWLDYCIVIN